MELSNVQLDEIKELKLLTGCADYDTIVHYMDNDLCNELNDKYAPCSNLFFVQKYKEAHKQKFNEDFIIN